MKTLLLLLFPVTLFAQIIEGPVVRIIDGDTFVMQVRAAVGCEEKGYFGKDSTVTIRLIKVDAPESDQPFGDLATLALARLLPVGFSCMVFELHRDKYPSRLDGAVMSAEYWHSVEALPENSRSQNMIADSLINLLLVERGLAWCFECKDDSAIYYAEHVARKLSRGLWAGKNPIPPWQWRKMSKEEKLAARR